MFNSCSIRVKKTSVHFADVYRMPLDVGQRSLVAAIPQFYHQFAWLEVFQPKGAGLLQLTAQVLQLAGLLLAFYFCVFLSLTLLAGFQQPEPAASKVLHGQFPSAAFAHLRFGGG